MVQRLCDEKQCCKVTFCPLELSFGKTLHTFQGQSAGPVNPGQQENAVRRIVVDPGDKTFEGKNPGLLYMAVSRATTMGNGDPRQSAILFTGNDMSTNRVVNLKLKRNGDTYQKVKLRDLWVNRLENNTLTPRINHEEMRSIIQWTTSFTMKEQDLLMALCNTAWRTKMRVDVNY